MKKYLLLASILLCGSQINAQSFSDIFSSSTVKDVVTSVTGGQTLSQDNILGEWTYLKPAAQLNSDNVLTSAAGTLATSEVESKLEEYCSKVGLTASTFKFTFESDNTFTCTVKTKNLSGTYTIDSNSNTLTLKFGVYSTINLGSITADVSLLTDSMSLLFQADSILSLISKVSSISSNSTLELLSSLSEQYDGLMLGFELEQTVDNSTESSASSAISTIKNLFN
ncbi:MAG: DUF4923 family protein [Rikenellaceae bacterium]